MLLIPTFQSPHGGSASRLLISASELRAQPLPRFSSHCGSVPYIAGLLKPPWAVKISPPLYFLSLCMVSFTSRDFKLYIIRIHNFYLSGNMLGVGFPM